MNDSKPWWQSTTIWGALVALICQVLSAFHVQVSGETQAHALDAIIQAAGVIAAVVAIIGRVKAKKSIGSGEYSISLAPILLSLCLFAGMAALTGCNAPPNAGAITQPTTQPAVGSKTAFLEASNTLKFLTRSATNARNAGWIPANIWHNQVLPAINGADRFLDDWQAQLGTPGAQQAQTAFESALKNVISGLADAQAREAAATPPTTPTHTTTRP